MKFDLVKSWAERHEKLDKPELYKVYHHFLNECCSMADRYCLKWPNGGADEKAIFLAAIHFIDLFFFENNYFSSGGI
jgi:hypothetical protein